MADLRSCFERAGFANVKTVLSSGNVAFGRDRIIVPGVMD
jgi:uncharacterized protein (DUF1697 family)